MSASARRKVAGLLLVLVCGAAKAGEQTALLTGNQAAIWLVLPSPDRTTYQVMAKPAGKPWRWVTTDIGAGTPTSTAAVGNRLHLLVRNPFGHLVFTGERGEYTTGRNPTDSRWPNGASPLAVCEAVSLAGSKSPGVLAVVPYGAGPSSKTARPTTEPIEPPARPAATTKHAGTKPVRLANLAVFLNTSDEWTYMTELADIRLSEQHRVLAVVAGRILYVLICGPAANRLAAWDGAHWQDVPLHGPTATAIPLAMVALEPDVQQEGTCPVVLLAKPVEQTGLHLLMAVYDPAKNAFAIRLITTAETKPATWNQANPPLAAGSGQQLSLVWQDGKRWKLALCDTRTGMLLEEEELDIFHRRPPAGGLTRILQYFVHGMLIAIILATLLLRRRAHAKPFALPENLKPGNLAKRALATVIDLVPCAIAVAVVGGALFPPPGIEHVRTREEALEFVRRHADSADTAYLVVAVLLLYTAYCIATELRFGATFGKRLMKLRVVGDEGQPLDLRSATLRNLWRVVELYPYVMLAIMILMFLTRYHRRLGDLLSGTAVVDAVPGPSPEAETLDATEKQEPDERGPRPPSPQQ